MRACVRVYVPPVSPSSKAPPGEPTCPLAACHALAAPARAHAADQPGLVVLDAARRLVGRRQPHRVSEGAPRLIAVLRGGPAASTKTKRFLKVSGNFRSSGLACKPNESAALGGTAERMPFVCRSGAPELCEGLKTKPQLAAWDRLAGSLAKGRRSSSWMAAIRVGPAQC